MRQPNWYSDPMKKTCIPKQRLSQRFWCSPLPVVLSPSQTAFPRWFTEVLSPQASIGRVEGRDDDWVKHATGAGHGVEAAMDQTWATFRVNLRRACRASFASQVTTARCLKTFIVPSSDMLTSCTLSFDPSQEFSTTERPASVRIWRVR